MALSGAILIIYCAVCDTPRLHWSRLKSSGVTMNSSQCKVAVICQLSMVGTAFVVRTKADREISESAP